MGFPVPSRATDDLITQAIWNADLVDNLNALSGQSVGPTRIVGTGGGFGERYHLAGFPQAVSMSAGGISTGKFFCSPLWLPSGGTVDRIAYNVTTGGSAGSVTRTGIYEAGSDLYPTNLIVDGGELSTTSTGVKVSTVSASLTAGTLYWIVIIAGTAAPTINFIPGQALLGVSPGSWTAVSAGFNRNQTYGALPSTFPAGPPTGFDLNIPALGVRYSA